MEIWCRCSIECLDVDYLAQRAKGMRCGAIAMLLEVDVEKRKMSRCVDILI